MRGSVLAAVLTLAAAGVVSLADDDEDDRVEDLMEKLHDGRRSPYRQLEREAEAAVPAWRVVDANVPWFLEMSRALAESKDADIRGSADGYVDAVRDVVGAARQRQAGAFKAAMQALGESCGDCHFDGGVGGELDD